MKRFIHDYSPVILTGFILGLIFIPPLIQFQSLYWGTPALQFIPWRIFAFEEIGKGRIPFFNPYNGLNAPFLANYQSALFYPPSWLLYILGMLGGNQLIGWGFGLLNYFHLIWAALGMMRLTHRLQINKFGQIISCIVFACSQCLIARQGFISMIWTAVWLPWLIFWIEERMNSSTRKISVGWAVCVGFMLLAGHAQWSFYQLLFCAIWWIWRSFICSPKHSSITKPSIDLFRDTVLGIGLASIQLFPTAELLLNSQRASSVEYELAMTYSFWPWRLLTLFFPNIFGNPGVGNYWGYGAYWEDAFYFGVLPAVLLFLSLKALISQKVEEKIHRQMILFLWVNALLAIILAMGKNTPIFPFLYQHIPGFDMFQAPARFLILAVFSFALLAGFGAQYWSKPEGKCLYWTRLATAGGAAIVVTSLAIHRAGVIEKQSIPTAFLITGSLLLLCGVLSLTIHLEGKLKYMWRIVAFSLLIVDVVISNYQVVPWIDSDIYQKNSSLENALLANENDAILVYHGEDNLYDLKFNKYLKFGDFRNNATHYNLRNDFIPDINIIDHVAVLNNFDPLLLARYAAFMDYLDNLKEGAQKKWLQDIGVTHKGSLDENDDAFFEQVLREVKPVLWTNCAIYTSDEITESLERLNQQILAKESFVNGQRCAIVAQKSEISEVVDPEANGVIQIVEETPQRMLVEIESDTSGWLTFRRSWYPGWKIKIDEGDTTNAVVTDVNFMGAMVPQGNHRVELFYQPTILFIGLAISLLSVIIIGGAKWIFV